MNKQQETLLKLRDGMNVREVAEASGCTPSAAWDRLHGLRHQGLADEVRNRQSNEVIRWYLTDRGRREQASLLALQERRNNAG